MIERRKHILRVPGNIDDLSRETNLQNQWRHNSEGLCFYPTLYDMYDNA